MDINLTCHCNKRFDALNDKVSVLHPCCHFVHKNCISKNLKKCPFCKKEILKITHHDDIQFLKDKQIIINHKSITPIHKEIDINYINAGYASVMFCAILNDIITFTEDSDIDIFMHKIIDVFNFKFKINDYTKKNKFHFDEKIIWKKSEDNKINKTIISNHTNDFDGLILYYLFRCGFVASEAVNDTSIGKLVSKKCNLLLFKRGETNGMVTKIKEYLKKNNKICIFPEGVFCYNDTILKFRTGAFYASDVICPVSIKYTTPIYDGNLLSSIFKLINSTREKIVEVNINDFEYGPFNDEKIENIRLNMAKQLNYELSNVSNKRLIDD